VQRLLGEASVFGAASCQSGVDENEVDSTKIEEVQITDRADFDIMFSHSRKDFLG